MGATIDENGLTIQTLDEIKAEYDAALRDPVLGYGADFSLEPTEPLPVLRDILAERESLVQGNLKTLFDSKNRASARGVFQDDLAALTGTVRLGASKSTIQAEFTGSANQDVDADRIFRHTPTLTLWDGPDTVTTLDGSGKATVTLTAKEDGPIEITASSNWEIVAGDPDLTSIASTASSVPGRLQESDEALAQRSEDEIAGMGKGSVPAIKANLLQRDDIRAEGVTNVTVYANNSGATDADGRDPYSIEILVDDNGGGDNQVIAKAIWEEIPAGRRTSGGVTASFNDVDAVSRTVKFSRVAHVDTHLRITVDTTGAEVVVEDQAALTATIKQALVDHGATYVAGRDVLPARFAAVAFGKVPSGAAVDVTAEQSLDGASWTPTFLSVTSRQKARFATTRVTVVYV